MEIKYRILSVDKNEHSLIIRYYTDILTEEILTSYFGDDGKPVIDDSGKPVRCRTDYNLSLWKTVYTEEELHDYIKQCAPAAWFKVLHFVKEINEPITHLNYIDSIIGKEHVFEPEVVSVKPAPVITEAEVNALIEKLKNA